MNTLRVTYKEIKTAKFKKYPLEHHFLAEAIRILLDNPTLVIEI